MKRTNPKEFHAKARNLSAGLNRIIGQSKLKALYETFDKLTDKEVKESKRSGCFRVKGKQTTKRQRVPNEPRGWNKSAPMAPQSGRSDLLPHRSDKLGVGVHHIRKERITIGNDVFYVNMQGMPA